MFLASESDIALRRNLIDLWIFAALQWLISSWAKFAAVPVNTEIFWRDSPTENPILQLCSLIPSPIVLQYWNTLVVLFRGLPGIWHPGAISTDSFSGHKRVEEQQSSTTLSRVHLFDCFVDSSGKTVEVLEGIHMLIEHLCHRCKGFLSWLNVCCLRRNCLFCIHSMRGISKYIIV